MSCLTAVLEIVASVGLRSLATAPAIAIPPLVWERWTSTTQISIRRLARQPFCSTPPAHKTRPVGTDALTLNDSGSANTATGYFALYNNTTGGDNTAIGSEAL